MMSHNPPGPAPPPEAGTPNTVTNVSGGANLNAQQAVNIGGDVVGHDKTTTDIAVSKFFAANDIREMDSPVTKSPKN